MMGIKAEVWKPVVGYEGLYEVSDLGNVKSVNKVILATNGKRFPYRSRVLNKQKDKRGYQYVALSKNGEHKKHKVHRLVAMAFLPNPQDFGCINHKDENKTNNCVDNLEWCDCYYNANYGTRNTRLSDTKRRLGCYNSKKVLQFDKQGNLISTYISTYDAERRTGKSRVGIGKCCRGKISFYSGYIWKYAS